MPDLSNTKRAIVVCWSIGLAMVLIALTTSTMLPSTKRGSLRFDDDESAATANPATSQPTDVPFTGDAAHISSSKSGVFNIVSTQPSASEPHIGSSKAAVFDIRAVSPSSQPASAIQTAPVEWPSERRVPRDGAFSSSKAGVFPLDRAVKPDPSTAPTTVPSR